MTTDLYVRIKAAVVAALIAADIPKIGTRIFSQYDCDTLNTTFPRITCITAGLTEDLPPGDSEHAAYDWPIGMMMEDNPGARAHQLEPNYLIIRKIVTDLFHQKRLSGIPNVAGGTVYPRVIFDPRLPQYGYVKSSLLAKFLAYENR